jgi:hypothetical protein
MQISGNIALMLPILNDTPRWLDIQERMERDFHDLVSLATLGESGEPTGEWEKIPAVIMVAE